MLSGNTIASHASIPPDQTTIELINDEGVVSDHLQLSEIDPIFASTFESMIKESFAEGKHFFLAKI